jgi:WD40 repeat protein
MHQTRYAHCEGYTDVCFTDKGSFLTTGEDGDVRIWQSFDDMDNTNVRVGDKCFAIAYKNGKIYVADDLNEVKKYDLETNESQGVITSFTLNCTCMAVNKSDTSLVCGSSDFEIHLVDLKSLKVTPFQGHDAPILSVCFDPLEKYFISSSCDGTARIWSIQTLNTVKTLSNLLPKSNDFMGTLLIQGHFDRRLFVNKI